MPTRDIPPQTLFAFICFPLFFCRVVITFVNSLNPDQDRQIVGPDFGSEPFITHIVLQKDILKKANFGKSQQMTTKL